MGIKIMASIIVLVALCIVSEYGSEYGAILDGKGTASPAIEVIVRQGSSSQWDNQGDELMVKRGDDTLLSIVLGPSTTQEVLLTLTLGPRGRIVNWGTDFAKATPSAGTIFTLLNCDGSLVQGFRTVMFARFDMGAAHPGILILALPQEGFEFWTLRKTGDRSGTLTRSIDPCYKKLIERGGKIKDAGVWNSSAMNCILYVQMGDSYRQFQISLPWPNLSPLGGNF